MTTPRIDSAEFDAATLTAAGVRAYTDPAEAAANLPCVLFLPPLVRYDRHNGGASVDWRLAVLAEPPHGLDAWAALDDLLDRLAAQVALTTAEPGVYTINEGRALPAYLCTVTD